MIVRYEKTADPAGSGNEKTTAASQDRAGDDSCRCKEASAMTPRQLLELMLRDLAFWKKAKKE